MLVSKRARMGLRVATALILAFLYVPLIVILVLSFSSSRAFIAVVMSARSCSLTDMSASVGNQA